MVYAKTETDSGMQKRNSGFQRGEGSGGRKLGQLQTIMYKIDSNKYILYSTENYSPYLTVFDVSTLVQKKLFGKTKGTNKSNQREFQLALNEDLLSYGMLIILKYLKGTNTNFRNANWTKRNRSIK